MELQDALLGWYEAVARDLPWRRTTDPYAILVSEVMLQQTQVARVVPRYESWLERWPTASALAAAEPAAVLRAWVGLGYNARALRLQAACAVVTRDGWPATAAGLRSLPGVGPYTAAAVAAFAWGETIAAVDVNVARVAGRLGRGSPSALLPAGSAAPWNQAMMELGATICRARSAACPVCPLASWCASAGQVEIAGRASAGSGRPRFQDTNRWVRGRVVAALAAGEELPADIAAERLAPALEGLVRDGLVRRDEHGLSLGSASQAGPGAASDEGTLDESFRGFGADPRRPGRHPGPPDPSTIQQDRLRNRAAPAIRPDRRSPGPPRGTTHLG